GPVVVEKHVENGVANGIAHIGAHVAAWRRRTHLDPRIFRESSSDEERVFGLDQTFFDTQVAVQGDAVARKKNADAWRSVIHVQKRYHIFPAKPRMQVEIRPECFDEQLARRVVDEEGQVQSFLCNFLPFVPLTLAMLPGGGAVEKARLARDRRRCGARTGSHAADLNQSPTGVANLGGWYGQQCALASEFTESEKEEVQAHGNRHRQEDREVLDRDQKEKADGHSAFRDCRDDLISNDLI